MSTLESTLSERKDELISHLAFAKAVEEQLFQGDSILLGETAITVRHLMTIKSALVMHLYNFVEALMNCALKELGTAVRTSPPSKWTHSTLREWLRSTGLDGNEDTRLRSIHDAALRILMVLPIEDVSFKKPPGVWSDKLIAKFLERLSISVSTPRHLKRKVGKQLSYGDKTPLEYLASLRNSIAHGEQSFEKCAANLTLTQISELSDVTIEYMEHVVRRLQSFVDDKRYLATGH